MDARTVVTDDGIRLHVDVAGAGPDVVVLSGGPGCVQYLADDAVAVPGVRAWYPEPRGVGRSGGGPHDLATAVRDLEAVRRAAGVDQWVVVGHSWGGDLAVRYALDHPASVRAVVAVAGCGVQRDRSWSEAYHRGKDREPAVDIAFDAGVHAALLASYGEWIHEPDLFRRLAASSVPMTFVAVALDIRPSWPLEQLAQLVPGGRFVRVPDVPHDLWAHAPAVWRDVVGRLCAEATSTGAGA